MLGGKEAVQHKDKQATFHSDEETPLDISLTKKNVSAVEGGDLRPCCDELLSSAGLRIASPKLRSEPTAAPVDDAQATKTPCAVDWHTQAMSGVLTLLVREVQDLKSALAAEREEARDRATRQANQIALLSKKIEELAMGVATCPPDGLSHLPTPAASCGRENSVAASPAGEGSSRNQCRQDSRRKKRSRRKRKAAQQPPAQTQPCPPSAVCSGHAPGGEQSQHDVSASKDLEEMATPKQSSQSAFGVPQSHSDESPSDFPGKGAIDEKETAASALHDLHNDTDNMAVSSPELAFKPPDCLDNALHSGSVGSTDCTSHSASVAPSVLSQVAGSEDRTSHEWTIVAGRQLQSHEAGSKSSSVA